MSALSAFLTPFSVNNQEAIAIFRQSNFGLQLIYALEYPAGLALFFGFLIWALTGAGQTFWIALGGFGLAGLGNYIGLRRAASA